MITITSSSLLVTLDLLNRIDFNKNQVFYYDYDHAYQILNIVKEKNGSDDNYELILGGASNLKFKVCDDEIQFSPRKVHISHEIANKISGMPPDISKYSF
ncbi:hypothetical protein [Vibrio caribbeanicus]|uniref:hypothetical protein n=1 Tax=Vibrio caribbeanicus TaxID=701175 RepID=UPI0030DA870F